jgi:hypothetical protein
MPPKVAAGWCEKKGRSVTVSSTHPANVATTKKKANVASRVATEPTRESPKCGAKTVANDWIAAQLLPHEYVPIATVAPQDAKINATVVAPCAGAAKSFTDLPPKKLSIPPVWNAWYSSCCQVLCYVGDGGALVGKCALCRSVCPGRKDVMLNPEQVAELKVIPCLAYDALTGIVSHPPSGGLPHFYP